MIESSEREEMGRWADKKRGRLAQVERDATEEALEIATGGTGESDRGK